MSGLELGLGLMCLQKQSSYMPANKASTPTTHIQKFIIIRVRVRDTIRIKDRVSVSVRVRIRVSVRIRVRVAQTTFI